MERRLAGATLQESTNRRDAQPAGPETSFEGRLVRPKKGAGILIFKYTISVAGKTDADPIIIVDH